MRCLTLAKSLRSSGLKVEFVCRVLSGNLIDIIQGNNFFVHKLSGSEFIKNNDISNYEIKNKYSKWLGVSLDQDAEETVMALQGKNPEWLVVDHYGIDKSWELYMRPHVGNIMVIDDLVNRKHDCNLLLDQNYSLGNKKRYQDLVPKFCKILLGPKFSLLRPEFWQARKLLKPKKREVKKVFVFFGGTDPNNISSLALEALSTPLLSHLKVDLAIGINNPHRKKIEFQVSSRKRTRLHVQIENISELMACSDLALGAGGSTTWERMCVGLPSIVFALADNQLPASKALYRDGFIRYIDGRGEISVKQLQNIILDYINHPQERFQHSIKGMQLVDGQGVKQVKEIMFTNLN
tara:strand:- start:300 stop:1349 length:1050 start_codon:yes stop_codon:yes gene_type:complete